MTSAAYMDDVIRSRDWLGHKNAYTELLALSPDYRRGPEHFEWNRSRNAFPRVSYAGSTSEVERFVRAYHGFRSVFMGLNPRLERLRNEKGYVRSTLESEIELCQNLLLDFDFEGGGNLEQREADFEMFLDRSREWWLDRGFLNPVRSASGAGYHLLAAFQPVPVAEIPDISERLKVFSEGFYSDYRQQLEQLEVRGDVVADLRRNWKIPGTKKPGGRLSRFYGGPREEDSVLREYLLSLDVEPAGGSDPRLREIPDWFPRLLKDDSYTRRLWRGEGKRRGDRSNSGYDFSLVQRLLRLGYSDLEELAAILSVRPKGVVQQKQKGDDYVGRTITNAWRRYNRKK